MELGVRKQSPQGSEACLTAIGHSPARVTSTLSLHTCSGNVTCCQGNAAASLHGFHRTTAVPPLVGKSFSLGPEGMLFPAFFLIPKAVATLPPWGMPGVIFTGVHPPLLGVLSITNQECASFSQYREILRGCTILLLLSELALILLPSAKLKLRKSSVGKVEFLWVYFPALRKSSEFRVFQ